jgi:iron complex outermembrane receptor protein
MTTKKALYCGISAGAFLAASAAFAGDASIDPINIAAVTGPEVERVTVTARRRLEDLQRVPLSVSVVTGETLDKTLTFNTSLLTQLVPSLNYTSPNPRNTAFTIRGLGSSVVAIAQANDGLEPGVGFYVDQVYHGRPATAAFDFLDIEKVEVLRGPQGTLFGKNTTAGAIHITTRAPTFEPEYRAELTGGNIGFFQGKAAISGPIVGNVLAGRISGIFTRRDGVITNAATGVDHNDIKNAGVRGQLLYRPNANFQYRLTTDFNSFDSNCCTQVHVRVGTTLKPAGQQYAALAAGQGYAPPSTNPFDRRTDIDAALAVKTSEGGITGIGDWNLGPVTVTSITAWRYWNWDAANDRDYTGRRVQLVQHIPSRQIQYSQELRVASNGDNNMIDYVAGLYWFQQTIKGHPITGYGPDGAHWLLGPPAVPGNLLDGYTSEGQTKFTTNSYAAFGEATWHTTQRLDLSFGARYTAEEKDGTFNSFVYGGPAGLSQTLINRQLSILRPQSYAASVSDGSWSGRATASYRITDDVMIYGNYARGYKSGGINMSGLPLNASNLPALATAVVRPERNDTGEIGVKTMLFDNRLLLNLDGFLTNVHDFQANIVDTAPGALRGYLANIEKVQVKGIELDSRLVLDDHFSAHLSGTYADGRYVSYTNGPCPLELIATSTKVCDLSGKPLSALPRWVVSTGGEYRYDLNPFGWDGEAYAIVETVYRSKTFGDSSISRYTVIDGYGLVNLAIGYRSFATWEAFLWVRNLFDENYIQNLTVQAGNSGLVVGTPSDPRTIGVTLRARY